ncbi:MAG: hybrid sensor histidine kinase/response regulator [Caulobacter sp.]|nr:hybrid sensor histidine kinase/response regulator [Caulobacter sp.]
MRDSLPLPLEEHPGPVMTASSEGAKPETAGRRFDLLTWAAAVLFLLALGLAAVPAFRAGPTTLASLLLLGGLGGVAFIGFLALRSGAAQAPAEDLDHDSFIDALPEAAAVAAPDGRILQSNAPWREALGALRRLPKGAGLFPAMAMARRGEIGHGALKAGGTERPVSVGRLSEDRLLVRLDEPPAEPLRITTDVPASAVALASAAPTQVAPKNLDAFATSSPFGAALLEGEDAFTATIVEANASLAAMTGAKPGAVFGELIEPVSRADAEARFAQGRGGPTEVHLARDHARIAHLYLARVAGRWTAYLVDVTEQKAMERQLAQANKMQAVGQLAAGVAHDFNNLISGINFQLDELQQRHPLGDPSYEGLTAVRQTAARAADLVRKLKTYSRQETVRRETLDLGEVISEFEVLLRRVLREDVPLKTEYGRNLPLVRADKGQLEMAVMNLAVNARDAIRSGGGTTVSIRTARLSHEDALRLGYGGDAPGDMALIEVSDDGPGIPLEIQQKIFEPFFTTKPVGEGTGFGLATVYGIVKQSDGWIHVDSAPGKGAAFRIFLPVHIPRAVAPGAVVEPVVKPRAVARDLSGVGRILFVEDEDSVRGVAARLLRARGYEVIEAADGEEALALAEEHAGKIDLLISDVVMPGMDGPTLLKHARGFLGDAPVMFISGYAEAEFSDLLEGETGVSFLAKPIDIKTLAERVKQELQAA